MQVTWELAILEWAVWMRAARLSPQTIELRRYHVRRLSSAFRNRSPWALTLADLADWLAQHEWKPETMRAYRASVRTFYSWGVLAGYVTKSPAALLPPIRPPRTKPRPAPEEALRSALATASERERLMVMLAAYEGLRRGEVARVHTRDVERDPEGGWRLRVTGKGGHVRHVPLSPAIAASLRALPPGWAFPGQIDGHLSPSYVGKLVSRLLPPGWTTHTLRHRFATRLRANGVQLDEIQDLLGHARLETTRVYAELPAGALRAAVMAVA